MLPVDVLKSLLIKPREATRNNLVATCPFCGKENHFFINKGINAKRIEHCWDCKKCGKDGNLITFLKQIGRLDLLEGRQVDTKKIILPSLEQDEEDVEEEVEDCKLPIGFKKCDWDKDKNVYTKYFKSRKFEKIDFDLYSPGYTNALSKYKDYAIIPVENNFSCKGFVSRCIEDSDYKPRYRNSETNMSKVLFGFDEASNKTRTAILLEGIFDKTATTTALDLHYQKEIKAFATFGKKISSYQVSLLRKIGIENIIILYDGRDAVNDIKKIGHQLNKEFDVYAGYTKDKDPNASTKEEIIDIINKIEPIEKFNRSKVQVPKLK